MYQHEKQNMLSTSCVENKTFYLASELMTEDMTPDHIHVEVTMVVNHPT